MDLLIGTMLMEGDSGGDSGGDNWIRKFRLAIEWKRKLEEHLWCSLGVIPEQLAVACVSNWKRSLEGAFDED